MPETPSTEDVLATYIEYWETCAGSSDRYATQFDNWLAKRDAARDRETAAKALSSLSAEFTRMSLELQESDRYAEDYWRGSAQALIAAAQLAEDRATSIGAGDE